MIDESNKDNNLEETQSKSNTKKKSIIITTVIVLAILVSGYLAAAYYFNSHFYFSTKINGQDVSRKTIGEVEKHIQKEIQQYSLTLVKNDQKKEVIDGKDISLKYHPQKELENAMKKQNPFLWPGSLFKKSNIEFPVGVEYDRELLLQQIEKLECVSDPEQVEPVSAKPVYDGNKFEIEKEVMGNKVNKEVLTSTIEKMIVESQKEFALQENGCYYEPQYRSDSPEVIAAKDKMNNYIKTSVTYDFNPYTETVDKSLIKDWLVLDENMQVSLSSDSIKGYISSLAAKYDTSGRERSFVTALGTTVQVKGGSYGWRIDRGEEYNALVANLEANETVTREPSYARRALSHQGNDFGSTYAEVDLSSQQMWFVQNGQVVLQSPVVTGNPSNGHATPQGVFTVSYTTRDAVLRGKVLPNGKREYESPVKYWMPFNGGIGFHDASWQSQFGGTRYKTHGSHGCINMPLDKAGQLFGYLKKGTPVICHY